MATGTPNHHQTHQAGRHLVVAEALLRGLPAEVVGRSTFVSVNGHKVQVHVARLGAWQVDPISAFLSSPAEFHVFVNVTEGIREFYVCPGDKVRAEVKARHDAYVASKGGVRPRNPRSQHTKIEPGDVYKWRNRWKPLT